MNRLTLLLIILLSGALRAEEPLPPVDFSQDIQPILAQKCLLCHGQDDQQGEVRLDLRERATGTAESGLQPVVPGDPDASELIRRITAGDPEERMPPQAPPLSAKEIDLLKRWIEQGAEYTPHWAYRPLTQPIPPVVQQSEWVRNPIDQFVLTKLEEQQIAPSPPADKYTLIKRLSYDLRGLPPTVEEIEEFVNDDSPLAWEHLVDRMLSSPHFGERWGRHWLDKARYADSDGYEKDNNRPNAWRYRTWVIDALNVDMPYDQFTIEQLAGDLLPDATPSQKLATAFHRQTLTNTEGGVDKEQFRVAAVMDRTETVGSVWLGLTVGCARCHSHKYDAFTHREYYQLYAFFDNGEEVNLNLPPTSEIQLAYEQQLQAHQRQVEALGQKLSVAKQTNQQEQISQLEKQRDELAKKTPKPPHFPVRVIAQRTKPRVTRLLHRGEFKQPQDEVTSSTPGTLPAISSRDPDTPPDRLDLARWLVDGENPLPPRVAVNQVWATLFGAGLVTTMNDFGVRGEQATHPELLDWLASEYIRQEWSTKQLIRTIVTSATYRQASAHRSELVQIDPNNRLLARQNRFRVEGEIVRDLALSVSGLLAHEIGGESVFPPMPASVAAISYAGNFRWNTSSGLDRYRRGMYTFFKRTAPHPNLITFDCPDSNTTCIERNRSNTPLAAMVTLNNETFVESAQAFSRRILTEIEGNDEERLSVAMQLCVTRPADPDEITALKSLLDSSREWYEQHPDAAKKLVSKYSLSHVSPAEQAAWVATLRIVLNLDEFLTRE